MTKPTHGGKRPGSGRKPKGDEAKQPTSVRLSPQVVAYARETGLNLGETLESTVRRTKAFRTWLASERERL